MRKRLEPWLIIAALAVVLGWSLWMDAHRWSVERAAAEHSRSQP